MHDMYDCIQEYGHIASIQLQDYIPATADMRGAASGNAGTTAVAFSMVSTSCPQATTGSAQVVACTMTTPEGDKAIYCKTSASIAEEVSTPAAQRGMHKTCRKLRDSLHLGLSRVTRCSITSKPSSLFANAPDK